MAVKVNFKKVTTIIAIAECYCWDPTLPTIFFTVNILFYSKCHITLVK